MLPQSDSNQGQLVPQSPFGGSPIASDCPYAQTREPPRKQPAAPYQTNPKRSARPPTCMKFIKMICSSFGSKCNYKHICLCCQGPHPEVMDYLSGEKTAGRVGTLPATERAITPLQISQPLWCHSAKIKTRLIIDLSSPDGHSVNDGIDKAL